MVQFAKTSQSAHVPFEERVINVIGNEIEQIVEDYLEENPPEGLSEEFETVSGNLKSYPYIITYDGDDIDYITYDIGGGNSIIKTFNYTLGILTTIVLSGDTPAGITLTKTLHYTGDNLTSVTYS